VSAPLEPTDGATALGRPVASGGWSPGHKWPAERAEVTCPASFAVGAKHQTT
jgi:hypothetical protein